MRIAVCDDDALCREQIGAIVNEYIKQHHPEGKVSVYEGAASLMDDVLRFGGFDIYILDIIMPGINGIQLGLELRQTDPSGKILYLTSSPEYAIDSYRTKAFDYILKPVKKERLTESLEEAIRTIAARKEKSLLVKTRESMMKLSLDTIMYVELVNRRVQYCTTSGASIEGSSIRTNFAESVQDLLTDSRFLLCGPGLAVNLYHITMVSSDTLHFRNGKQLYIGKRAGRDVRSAWSDFWMNEEGSV